MDPKILWLRRHFSWMGQHSGYDQVCDAISELQPGNYQSIWQKPSKRRNKVSNRLLQRLAIRAKSSPVYSSASAAAEVKAIWQSLLYKPHLIHITYVETILGILPDWEKHLSLKMVGTAHQPAGWWRLVHRYPESISALDALIVPANREVSYFEQYLPGRVYFIPHGVDTEFFRPNGKQIDFKTNANSPRCIFSGKYLRDLRTLAEVIDKVLAQNPGIKFDIILPRSHRDRHDPSLIRMASHEQVCWHADLADEQLRSLYQQASMLVLPILDSTANNALLEAIACGLPVVSNDVGGLRDYTRDTFADLLPVGDVDGLVNAILKLANDPQEREKRGKAARSFTEQNLNWTQIAKRTMEVYGKVLSD